MQSSQRHAVAPFRDLVVKADREDNKVDNRPPELFSSFCAHHEPQFLSVAANIFAALLVSDRGHGVPGCVTLRYLDHYMCCRDGDPCLDEFGIIGFNKDS